MSDDDSGRRPKIREHPSRNDGQRRIAHRQADALSIDPCVTLPPMTEAQSTAWEAWLATKPAVLVERARVYPMHVLYRLRTTGHLVFLLTYAINDEGACERCMVAVAAQHNPGVRNHRTVVRFDDLDPTATLAPGYAPTADGAELPVELTQRVLSVCEDGHETPIADHEGRAIDARVPVVRPVPSCASCGKPVTEYPCASCGWGGLKSDECPRCRKAASVSTAACPHCGWDLPF